MIKKSLFFQCRNIKDIYNARIKLATKELENLPQDMQHANYEQKKLLDELLPLEEELVKRNVNMETFYDRDCLNQYQTEGDKIKYKIRVAKKALEIFRKDDRKETTPLQNQVIDTSKTNDSEDKMKGFTPLKTVLAWLFVIIFAGIPAICPCIRQHLTKNQFCKINQIGVFRPKLLTEENSCKQIFKNQQ